MPRTADHDARRTLIRDAVRQVAVSDGLAAVTIARTAEAAGISVGLVQHYYASKDDLVVAVYEQLLDQMHARVDAGIARAERKHARIEHILGEALHQLLPLDKARREEVYLDLTFTGLALDNPRLLAALRGSEAHLTERVRQAVANGKECGEVEPGLDVEVAATGLVATVRGLARAGYLAHGRGSAEARRRASAVIEQRCAQIFTGPCSRQQGAG